MHPDAEKKLLNLDGRGYSLFRGIKLRFKGYRAASDEWDHDHCRFCGAKFFEPDGPDYLHYGYATCEDYYWGAEYEWICEKCFDRYRNVMAWRVIGDAPKRVRRLYETGKRVPPPPRNFCRTEKAGEPQPTRS